MVFLFALAALISTYAGGLFALKYRDNLHRILGFASGVLIGAVFFDLLPEAFAIRKSDNLIEVTLPLVIGFLSFHILQRLFFLHSCPEEEHGSQPHFHVAQLGAGTFTLHSFFDGVAIGVSFQVDHVFGMIIAFAVIAHDFSDGLNTVTLLLRHRVNERKTRIWLLADAVAPFAGILVSQMITLPETFLANLLSIFAGFFLYIGASDLLPETHHAHKQWQTLGATVAGAAFMFLVSSFLLQ